MAFIEDYNKIYTVAGRLIITPARIRQYLEHKDYLIITIGAGKNDVEYGKDIGGNALCYDRYGTLKWQSKSKNVAEIFLKNNQLCFYDTSSIGYICVINIENGEIIELIPTK